MKMNIQSLALAPVIVISLASCDSNNERDQGNIPQSSKRDEAYVIAPRMIRDDGAYELLATIDGVEPNRQFVANLKLVTAQRLELKRLRDVTDKGEDHGEAISVLEKKLAENAAVMLKNYGYSLNSNYLFMPVESSLMKVDGDKKEMVMKMDTPTQYDRLQALRSQYAQAAQKSGGDSAEAKGFSLELMESYGFNVKLNYTLDIRKSALYRNVGK